MTGERDDVRISLAGADRIDDLEPVYVALYEHHVAVSTWNPAPPRGADVAWSRRRGRWAKTLAAPNGVLIVAERDGRVVGALLGEVDDEDGGGSDTHATPERAAHVHDLAVLPSERGSGIGRRLLERFEAEIRARGAGAYGLEVMPGNDAAARFYAALGFEHAATTLWKTLPADG